MKLTKAAIDAMKYDGKSPKAKDVRWDDDVQGFGVRVWASGRKTFVLDYRFEGRRRYLTLGDYGPLTLQQARELAQLRRADILRGVDPLAEKRRRARGETVSDLAKSYLAHARVRKASWEKDETNLRIYVLPELGGLKIKAVRRADVARLHQKIWVEKKKPTTANRVLALVSRMWNLAAYELGFYEDSDPYRNPAKGIARAPEVKRKRFVTKDEMPRLAAAIDAEPNVWIKALIWLYLFTGMRKSELQNLRWEDVDLPGGKVHVEKTKGGRPLDLPLSSAAVYMFQQIPHLRGNPYVFCGGRKARPIVNVKDPWIRIRKAAKLEDVRLHDLRRTVGSWLAMSGASLPLIGQVLNHADIAVTQVYARFQQDPVAAALEAHGRQIREASGLHLAASGDADSDVD